MTRMYSVSHAKELNFAFTICRQANVKCNLDGFASQDRSSQHFTQPVNEEHQHMAHIALCTSVVGEHYNILLSNILFVLVE